MPLITIFIMGTEVLSILINSKLAVSRYIKMKPHPSALPFLHLIFTNDLFIFAEDDLFIFTEASSHIMLIIKIIFNICILIKGGLRNLNEGGEGRRQATCDFFRNN